MATDHPLLGTPLPVRGVTLRNRIVGAPMERNYCDRAGRVTQRYADYLVRRAAGGVGLLFTESCYVSQAGKARHLQMGLHEDHVIGDLATLVDAVHAEDALIGVELNHGGRVVPSAVSQMQPVGPSPIACTEIKGEVPRQLSVGEIDDVIGQFASAARRAIKAGVDVIAVHGAHGYLIGQFLSPRSNERDDEYGRPTAFLNRVLSAVRAEVGDAVPVVLRLSAFEGLPDGLDEEGSFALTHDMALDVVDVVDLSAGTYGAGEWITPSGEVAEGYLTRLARRYRGPGRLVSCAGRITTGESAEKALADGMDLVVVGRALHADPDWARHAIRGTEPRPCISCNQGCADVIHRGLPLWCAANPQTGLEGKVDYPAPNVAAGLGRRCLLVVGGGPAGLEAALTAARSGLQVRLIEQTDHLGGQFAMAATLRSKPQFHRLLRWYEAQLASLDVEVHLNRQVTHGDLDPAATAGVVVATGGVGHLPSVPGIDLDRVVEVRTWLSGDADVPEGAAITVWGADRAGTFVADELAQHGRGVVLVTAEQDLAPDAGGREKQHAVRRLRELPNVRVELGTTVERILRDILVCRRAGEEFLLNQAGPILVSHGTVPARRPSLLGELVPTTPVAVVGEARGKATFDDAIASGHRETRRLCGELERQAIMTATA